MSGAAEVRIPRQVHAKSNFIGLATFMMTRASKAETIMLFNKFNIEQGLF